MSRPESVSSRIARRGSRSIIWRISLRFFSPPEKPSLRGRRSSASSMSTSFTFSRMSSCMKSIASSSSSPRARRHRVDRRLDEVRVVDPRDLHRVLEREEEPALGALVGLEAEKIIALPSDAPGRHLVAFAPGEHVAQAALARAVRPHDRVHLAGPDHEVHAVEDRIAVHGDVETGDFEKGCGHGQLGCGGARGLRRGLRAGRAARARRRLAPSGVQPIAPSRLTLRRLRASTANSIGSSLNTSLQKPFTIIETASSADSPRLMQ